MSDRMTPLSFDRLMEWALGGERTLGSVYAGKGLPLGPAAGPHTQLAQNIIAAYAAGGRYFELKTVQTLDGEDLKVSKPCITAADECYNCEWSTELRVSQAMEEYIKAWYAINLLSNRLGLGGGFVFNMSVGYDMQGIASPKLDAFIEGLKDASRTDIWQVCREWSNEDISPHVSSSVTLSTLHGCPPSEIERIALYLINEKGLNTQVKCNPTLLGYRRAKELLDSLGYGYVKFDERHFEHDMSLESALPMFERLRLAAAARGLTFGVKLTNTFPVQVTGGELPSEEMYMSGRALFPLTISVAAMVAEATKGALPISFSGGADEYNVKSLLEAGLGPVTAATELLKPGGYGRLTGMAQAARDAVIPNGVDVEKTRRLADECASDPHYKKNSKKTPRKLEGKAPRGACAVSPCRSGCPLEQDIPAYLRLVGKGEYLEALRVIAQRNPLPFTTGTICTHRCEDMCRKGFYDGPCGIRETKLEAAQKGYAELLASITPSPVNSSKRVAVVGGGPAGLSAAWFLSRAGIPATVFEKRSQPGGIPRHVIPEFRIPVESVEKDVAIIEASGVGIRCGAEAPPPDELKAMGYTDIILACGAWVPGELRMDYGTSLNALEFLERFKSDPKNVKLGGSVAVIGGGNTAMDAARAAKRVTGVRKVTVVYRRTRELMPAQAEELEQAEAEGVVLAELLSPIGLAEGKLTCRVMRLGDPNSSGRRSPEPSEDTVVIDADTIIAAVGERADTSLLEKYKAYVIGDARRGPATVAEAIADAWAAASSIAGNISNDRYERENVAPEKNTGGRCLECATECGCCAQVCPNRANLSVRTRDGRLWAVHLDALCNECGNCETFCPYTSAPYRDNFTLFWERRDFEESSNDGALPLDGGHYLARLDGVTLTGAELPDDIVSLLETLKKQYACFWPNV